MPVREDSACSIPHCHEYSSSTLPRPILEITFTKMKSQLILKFPFNTTTQPKQDNLWDKKTDENYSPRKSRKMSRKMKKEIGTPTGDGDGDTWTEYVVITDKKSGRLRSSFRSHLTNKCIWDEPPSGASHIVLVYEKNTMCEI
jgi:hypothetical protein